MVCPGQGEGGGRGGGGVSESFSVSHCLLSTAGPVIVFPHGKLKRVNAGEDVTLICDTLASKPDVTKLTISSEGVALANTTAARVLAYTVITALLSDNGTNYTCTAVNRFGENSKTFPLIVQGVCVCVSTLCISVSVSLATKLCQKVAISPSPQPDLTWWTTRQWSPRFSLS